MPPPETPLAWADPTPQEPASAGASPETFRLPSTALFLGLVPIFSGQARRGDLAAALYGELHEGLDEPPAARPAQVRTYIIHSGRESTARTSLSLFDDDPTWREGELSALIKRQFGPSGLKHLLGVFIAAEEEGVLGGSEPGAFIFDINRHLDILGYKRSNRVGGKAYHTSKHLSDAHEIVALLCSLTIVQEIRLGARRGTTLKVRLLIDEASAETWEETLADGEKLRQRVATNERFFLRINPQLFRVAAEGTRRQQFQYTHQLKRLARENAHSHALVLTLGVHLPIKFRMNGGLPLHYTARAFLRMAGIPEEDYAVYEQLERLEKALRYMVDQGYLAAFETPRFRYAAPEAAAPGGEAPAPAAPSAERARPVLTVGPRPDGHLEEPLEETWRVEPPAFLRQLLVQTLARHSLEVAGAGAPDAEASGFAALPRPTGAVRGRDPRLPGLDVDGQPPTSGKLLREVRQKLGLSQGRLGERLGVTQAAISMAEADRRPQMAARLFELARRLTPES